ncbi:MAG: hypothetical protein IKS42_08215 [Oscillospiraceae bacterium]|nr:hypothetical protein [Oscillospiraceae bacterium]
MDTFMHYFHLLIPVVFLIGGIITVIQAIIGSPKVYEESKNPNMQRQLQQIGKTKARILHAVGGLIMAGFGAWLLHGWLFVPQ